MFWLICSRRPSHHQQAGFTLAEMLTWMILVGVLAAPVVPAMQEALSRWRSLEAQNTLQRAVRYTQSLAIQRQRTFTLAAVTPCTNPAGLSVPTSLEWSCGWIVFEDLNLNRQHDEAEALWLTHQAVWPLQLHNTLTRPVRFDREGLTTDWGTWSDCDPSHPQGLSRWKATLSRLGRLNVQTQQLEGCDA